MACLMLPSVHSVCRACCCSQKAADVETVRYQVCRLMRMLVQITNTLDKIPEEVGLAGCIDGGTGCIGCLLHACCWRQRVRPDDAPLAVRVRNDYRLGIIASSSSCSVLCSSPGLPRHATCLSARWPAGTWHLPACATAILSG
jgi:hypothetical protein